MADFECACVRDGLIPDPSAYNFKAVTDWEKKKWCAHGWDARWFTIAEWEARGVPPAQPS